MIEAEKTKVVAMVVGPNARLGAGLGRRSSRFGAAALFVITLGALSGCSDKEPQTAETKDVASSTDLGASGDQVDGGKSDGIGDTGVDAGPPIVTEDFWVVYGHRYRLPGADESKNDLVLTSWKNPAALTNAGLFGIGVDPRDAKKPAPNLTQLAFKGAGAFKDIGCRFGCVFSKDLKYIAISTGQPGVDGRTFQLATVDEQLKVIVGKFGKIEKIAHLEFAGPYLFYSTPDLCSGTGKCQYAIHRWGPLGEPDSKDEVIVARMAPDDDVDVKDQDTTYNGYFRASAKGNTLTFLTTTIRSVKLWAWHQNAEGAASTSLLDYVCANPNGDSCVGTGSEYHDDDPIAISADGKSVVFFAIVDRWLRARKYELGSEKASVFTDMVEVPSGGAYLQTYCKTLQPWQYGQVKGQPEFSADGSTVYFLGYSDCPKGGTQKKWTNIMALPVARIGSKFTQDDWVGITHNARTDLPSNIVISSFMLSPERQVIVASGTTSIGQTGSPLVDGDQRARLDTELYSLIIGDDHMTQITNEAAWATDAPESVLPVLAN